MSLSQDSKPTIHPFAWFLIIGTGLSRAALFITLPFLSIYISDHFGVSAEVTGLIMGLGPLCGIICAFLMGYISDQFGRKTILQVSLFFWAIAFLGYSWANQLWMIAVLHMIYGASRASFEAVATALLTDVTVHELRKKVFHLRYYAINIGACIGPPIGSWLILQKGAQGFWITSSVYFLYFFAFQFFIRTFRKQLGKSETGASKIKFSEVMKILAKDNAVFLFILANILMIVGFAQFETTLPQFLKNVHGTYGIKCFAAISFTNAITIVLFQFPLANFMKNISVVRQIIIGYILFSIGCMSMALFTAVPIWMTLSMFVFTFGEMLTFSNSYVWIDRISPANMKGTYFGLTELNTLGFVVGPFLGGWIMEHYNASWMFVILGSLAWISIFLFNIGNNRVEARSQ